jgi:hypothetical protein
MRKFFTSAGFCLALALASVSQAATIDIGNHVLLPNTPNQQIQIFAAGGEEIQGVDMFLELGMSSNEGPTIAGISLQGAGTLFGSNATPPNTASLPGNPRYWTADVATLNGTIPLLPTTPLAIVTIDTTGITASSSDKTFVLNASPAPNFTKFLVTTGTFELFPVGSTQGSITIRAVPEPSTMILAGLAGIALVVFGARRKR